LEFIGYWWVLDELQKDWHLEANIVVLIGILRMAGGEATPSDDKLLKVDRV